jgi:GDPmannose 4,6-dehydratase
VRTALLYGVTGQDGSFMADLLLSKGYYVVGVKRRTSVINTSRIDHNYNNPRFKLEYGDLNDVGSMYNLLNIYGPSEIYNFAAQSHVKVSFDVSETTVDGIVMGTLRLLNAIKTIVPYSKFYQASSSEMFGVNPNMPLNEESRFMPVSPYACAKLFAHNLVNNYRKSYNLFACSGILFNHESERRGETFVSRKVTMAAARISLGLQQRLILGNIDACRDWGYAPDYCDAVYSMLQQDEPDDYVVATGIKYSVRELCDIAFGLFNLDYTRYVEVDEKYFRLQEVPVLLGDSAKARNKLGWQPRVSFEEMIKKMCYCDLQIAEKEKRNVL